MDLLTIFGLCAVTAMVVFYALEHRSPRFILAFAGSCALASVYGFLQGAWPFGIVEAVWTIVAVQRWWRVKDVPGARKLATVVEEAVGAPKTTEPSTPEEIVLNAIRTKGKAQRLDLLPQVGISRSSLGRLLDQMEARGLIRQEGDRKVSYYVLARKSGQNL